MKLSLNWLNEYVDLDGLSVDEIIDKVIKAGFEVEEVTRLGYGTDLIVGKVVSCKMHPNSDHLHVTKVDIGSDVLDIVCGAPNCREGLKVIVALPGCDLVAGQIKSSTIRGEASNGMLCSLLELDIPEELLSDDSPSHNGIEELDDRFQVGDKDVLKKLGYGDIILDLSVYANRPDCLSMFGMAKEMAAILDRPCILPIADDSFGLGKKTDFTVSSLSKNCTHFLAKVCGSVKIKESPDWMKSHLNANGIKTINNLVDISNYVMLETGQPLHFYDLRSNPAKEITVRDDFEGEYIALDGVTYKMEKGDLMITSQGVPIGIAGIMGGDATKILDDTSSLIIESALFDHAQVRRTSNRLGLQTEAAARFAKGLDPMAQQMAMDRAVQLLIQLADASDFETVCEYGKSDYEPYTVSETLTHLNALTGKQYTMEEAVSVMKRLDFAPEVNGDEFVAHIPSRRSADIKIREDIDEEIVRLTDFDDLKSTLPQTPQTIGKLTPIQRLRRNLKDILTANGLQEVISYTLVSQDYIDNSLLPLGEAISLLTPLSDERKYVRTSLMNSMLETLSYNLGHFNENVNIFEISKVYAKGKEEERLAILLNGEYETSYVKHLHLNGDFYVLKGILMGLLDKLGYDAARIGIKENRNDVVHLHPYVSCEITLDQKSIGILGKIHPSYAAKFRCKEVYYTEINLDALLEAKTAKVKAPTVNKYPSISRDISILVKDEVRSDELIKTARKAGGSLVSSVEVFDIYKGENVPEGLKSVSLNIVYEDKTKTLKAEDISPSHEKILSELNKLYDANLR